MREIIDFHIHPFYSTARNVCFYEGVVKDYSDIKTELLRAGITIACGSVIERMEIDDFNKIRALNDEALQLRELYEGFYIPGVHIHPAFVEESIDELKRMSENNVKLVGELVPYYMGWEDYYDDRMHKIYEAIDELGMIVSVHTQREETLEEAIKNFPNITFVGAHPGNKDSFFAHIDRMKKYDNYYMDLSGTGIFRYGLIKHAVNEVGSERLLFGTDFPICNPQMYVQAVLFEKLRDIDFENIFCNNAKRLLKLK